ncbi:MAG: DUF2336 domain-containing protein [Xanthobacteraceae bacterium]
MSVDQSVMSDLEQAILVSSTERRTASLQHVIDLFITRAPEFSEAQVGLFDVVIMRLASAIEISARARLAERLAPVPNAPPRTIQTLAFDDAIEVAGPVLTHSERLDDATLVRNASTKSQRHLLAIAQRKTIGPSITDVLVERGDSIVVAKAAQNPGAKFSDAGYSGLIQRSSADERLAIIVGKRPELPRHQFLKLLSVASKSARIKLERENPQALDEIRRVVHEVELNVQSQLIAESHEYSKALSTIEDLHRAGRLLEKDVARLAEKGEFEETIVAMSLIADVPIAVAERALLNARPELLLMMLKAMEFSWSTVKIILNLRAQSQPTAPVDIEQCLASFERIKLATAIQAVRFHRGEKN